MDRAREAGRAGAAAVFAALHRAADREVGAIIFTVSLLDRTAGFARRAYTSHPDVYPLTGTKPMAEDDWSRHVIVGRKTYVANRLEDFAPLFPDHALIDALGCQSVVNVPVLDQGEVIGTVNLLHVAGHYTPERVARIEALVARETPGLVTALRTADL